MSPVRAEKSGKQGRERWGMLTWQNYLVGQHSWHTVTLLTIINLVSERSLWLCALPAVVFAYFCVSLLFVYLTSLFFKRLLSVNVFLCILTCIDMPCGTSPYLWHLPFTITMAFTIDLQLSSSRKIKSILRFPVSFVKERQGGDLETLWFPWWYSANWAHFYSSTVPVFFSSSLFLTLVDLFVLSNVFVVPSQSRE